MAASAGCLLQQQQTVLWEGAVELLRYGEGTAEARFAQPVLVTGFKATAGSLEGGLQLPQLIKGFARDLHSPTAARFALLFHAVAVPQQEQQEWRVDQVFPTQHVWLRGRCRSIKVQLLGFALDDAPQQIKAAAEARFGPLPEASPLLLLPSTQRGGGQQQAPVSPAAAPSLPRPPGRQLPLGKIPPAFVLTLAPVAEYWGRCARTLPLPYRSSRPHTADLMACQEMAEAVLAAQRGSPAALKAKLANTKNVRGLAVDWDGIRDSVLDLATYCCSALGDTLVDPTDVALASAGVCCAIMLAACQDGAAQFLAWPSGGVGVAGAIAVRDLVSTPNQPGQWQAWSMGLVDLLLESCPAVAGPTLQGTLNPAGIPEPQPAQDAAADADAAGAAAAEPLLPQQDSGIAPADKTHHDASAAAAAGADSVSEPASSAGVEAAAESADGLPAAKRQRFEQHAEAPAPEPVAADAAAIDTQQAPLRAADVPPSAQTPQPDAEPDADSEQQLGTDELGSGLESDALLAGLEQGSDIPEDEQAGPARSKRHRHQQDTDADADANGLDEVEDSEQDGGSGGWGAADGGSEELVDAAGGQQQGGEGQEVALEEGDYPEADEDAIRAEAAAKAARRRVERRPPVCALACGQLYAAILQMSMSPMSHRAAVSCQSVLRRLRAYRCLDALRATVSPVLSGKVDPLQLSTQDVCSLVNSAAAAANDLAALVLQPRPSSRSLFLYAQPEGQADSGSALLSQPAQEADFCVLQLLLSFQAVEMLSVVSCCIGAHLSRLTHSHDQQQQQQLEGANQHTQPQQQNGLQPPTQQQPQQPPEPPDKPAGSLAAEQQSRLCLQHAQLLDSIRALTSALTASSGGWSFLTAARDGLAALAAAVCPTRQVCLDGGHFSPDTSAPYDPQHGWEAARQALTAAASGLAGDTTGGDSSAAGDLSDSLQRLWLLVEATAALQGAEDVLSGKDKTPGAVDKLNAAIKTLFVGGFASELGQQSLVSALSACSPAITQLGVLLKHCSEVHAAAADAEDQMPGSQQSQERALNLALGLRVVYGALYAPEVLLALVCSPHLDAIAAWLPLTIVLHDAIRQQLHQHEKFAPAAARAAFPDVSVSDPAALRECGLPSALLPGGAAAAHGRSQAVLMQLHGAVLTAHNLVQLWQGRDAWAPLGSGSAGKLLEWLHAQLPKLEAAASKPPEPSEPEGVAPKLPKKASAAYVAAHASDSDTQLDGAAAVGGAAPPAGRDVGSDAVVDFMRNAACRSAALCSLHLLDMLLHGAPQSIRTMAQQERREASSMTKQTVAAFVPTVPLGPGRRSSSAGGGALPVDGAAAGAVSVGDAAAEGNDGFAAREVVQELLDGVPVKLNPDQEAVQVEVFELLERALRTATVALRSSDADLWWLVKGGSQQDILSVLQARTAAAALMRAACSTTASLLVHLSDADPQHGGQSCAVHQDGLLDALICAHSAIVTCQEGLQACVPQQQLLPFITRATDPWLDPVQRAAADAAVGAASLRACGGRVLLLLEARQALAVCLRCWQLQGWWPDPVGALLGSFPRASTAAEGFAKEDGEAHREGDPSARPPPPPRQDPRQLLSSLLGLADLCPEEWPHRGASQVAARQRDAAAAATAGDAGNSTSQGPAAFERPSLILLRQSVADAIEVHWDSVERLIDFGLSCSTRVARLVLVRMLARMAGLGAGLAPLLGPKVLLAVCSRLYGVQQLRKGLASRLLQVMQGPTAAAESSKQQLIDREINALHLQLRGTAQVCEVLLPLCGAPSIKSVLTEHKAAGVLGKAVYALVKPAADLVQLAADEEAAAGTVRASNSNIAAGSSAPAVGPGLARVGSEVQVLAGLLLQLVSVLMDADISMNPWADRSRRELLDSPSISTSSITIAWVLAAAPHLSPANMAAAAQLLAGRSAAATAAAAAAEAAAEAKSAGTPLDKAADPSARAQQSREAEEGQLGGAPDRVQQPAGSPVCLSGSAKGRAVLLRIGRQWQLLEQSLRKVQEKEAQVRLGAVLPGAAAAMPLPPPVQVEGPLTQAELQASAEWAAATLEATQCAGGPDPSHAASCAAIAQVLRELSGSSSACAAAWQAYEAVVESEAQQQLKPQHTWTRFIVAAKSAAAAHRPGGPNQQSPATLLSSPPLLLACDAACLDFWAASAASVQHADACSLAPVCYPHTAARAADSASSWWPQPLLVGGSNPRQRSQAVEDVTEAAEEEDRKRRDRADEGGPDGGGGGDDDDQDGGGGGPGGGFVPAVYAQRGPQFWGDEHSNRKASRHVDEFQRQQCHTCGQEGHWAATCPQGGATACFVCGQEGHLARDCPQGPLKCYQCGEEGHLARDCPQGQVKCFQCGEEGHFARDCPKGPLKCYKCGEEGHLARDCLAPEKCHRCGQPGHLVKDCKAPAGHRGPEPIQLPPPPPPPPPPPRPREGPGPGLPPWHGRGSSSVAGPRQLAPMQQSSPADHPQVVSPRDACGGGGSSAAAAAPADPRLKARRSSQQGGAGGAGGSVSPLSPSGGSSGSGLFWPHSGVLPPGVRVPVPGGGGIGGGVLMPAAASSMLAATPGAVPSAGAAAAGPGGGGDADADADAALLQGLLVDDSQDAAAAAAGGTTASGEGLQEQGDGETGIGQYLDDLLDGMGGDGEDQEPDDEAGYGVTEAGGL